MYSVLKCSLCSCKLIKLVLKPGEQQYTIVYAHNYWKHGNKYLSHTISLGPIFALSYFNNLLELGVWHSNKYSLFAVQLYSNHLNIINEKFSRIWMNLFAASTFTVSMSDLFRDRPLEFKTSKRLKIQPTSQSRSSDWP